MEDFTNRTVRIEPFTTGSYLDIYVSLVKIIKFCLSIKNLPSKTPPPKGIPVDFHSSGIPGKNLTGILEEPVGKKYPCVP